LNVEFSKYNLRYDRISNSNFYSTLWNVATQLSSSPLARCLKAVNLKKEKKYMQRPSIFASILFVLLLWSSFAVAQQTKQWSVSGTVGSSTQLSLSYNLFPQLQLSFVAGPIGNIMTTSTDRVGLSVIYYFSNSDNPMFIGYLHGKTSRSSHTIINVVPIGIQHKMSDDFSVRLAAELTSMINEFNNVVGGVGISLGGSIYL
jgi:hypothetical protein